MLATCSTGLAQVPTDGVLQVGDDVSEFLQRQYTLGRLGNAFVNSQPLSAYEAQAYLDTLALNADRLSRVDRELLARYRGAPGPGTEAVRRWLGHPPYVYANGRDAFSVEGDGYALQLNPAAYLSAGYARRTATEALPDPSVVTWRNTRAIRGSGHLGSVFFETRLEETQYTPVRLTNAFGTSPRERIVRFLPRGPGERDRGVYDLGSAMGVVGFRSRFFEVRFGRDRNRWSSGTGSLFLSDFAPAYDQLQIRTTFWRVQYVNLYTGLEQRFPLVPREDATPRKFGAMHRLTVNVTDRVQAELFEGVVYLPDTSSGRPGYSFAFLNPLILYHQVEKDYNRRGNVLVGTGLSWIAAPGLRLYGQLLLTEFVGSEIFSGRGYWANKHAFLVGLDAVGRLHPAVDVRIEYAQARPYLYSHHGSGSYTHYNDVLGHPAGQNFRDVALFLHSRPTARTRLAASVAYTQRGRDTATQNFGGEPLLSYNTRVSEYGVSLLQGVRQDTWLGEFNAGYEVLPGLYLEGAVTLESISDEETGLYRYINPSILFRWNLPFKSLRY